MKFTHIRVSEYFTFAKQIFHSKAISLARRANFVEKSTCESKCFFLAPRTGLEPVTRQIQTPKLVRTTRGRHGSHIEFLCAKHFASKILALCL